jgi:hypothetical protein
MWDNHLHINMRELPKPGEKWRRSDGRHYLIQGLSQHADTGETLVVCRSLARPFVSLAHPVGAFMAPVEERSLEPKFERVDED